MPRPTLCFRMALVSSAGVTAPLQQTDGIVACTARGTTEHGPAAKLVDVQECNTSADATVTCANTSLVASTQSLVVSSQALEVATQSLVVSSQALDAGAPSSSAARTLSAEAKRRLREIFDLCDADQNGYVSKIELIKACRSSARIATFFGLPQQIRQEDGSRTAVELFFQDIDINSDRQISWEELQQFYVSKMPAQSCSKSNRSDEGTTLEALQDEHLGVNCTTRVSGAAFQALHDKHEEDPLTSGATTEDLQDEDSEVTSTSDEDAFAESSLRRLAPVSNEDWKRAAERRDWREWREEQAVLLFLRSNGYKSMDKQKRTWIFKTALPLHTAARKNNLKIVQLLLKAGVDPKCIDYKGRSPEELAMKCDCDGSHAAVISALRASKQ